MPRKKKKTIDLALMTSQQVKETEAEITFLEKMLKADQSGEFGRPKITDTGEFRAKIIEKKELLDNYSPRKMRGPSANKAYARAKELAEKIKAEMPSNKDYNRSYPSKKSRVSADFDFERAVQQQVAFQTNRGLQNMIHEYKNIMARIDPDDPTIRNIETLRE